MPTLYGDKHAFGAYIGQRECKAEYGQNSARTQKVRTASGRHHLFSDKHIALLVIALLSENCVCADLLFARNVVSVRQLTKRA